MSGEITVRCLQEYIKSVYRNRQRKSRDEEARVHP